MLDTPTRAPTHSGILTPSTVPTTLLLALDHPVGAMRLQALVEVRAQLGGEADGVAAAVSANPTIRSLLLPTLLRRLHDDDPLVAACALQVDGGEGEGEGVGVGRLLLQIAECAAEEGIARLGDLHQAIAVHGQRGSSVRDSTYAAPKTTGRENLP